MEDSVTVTLTGRALELARAMVANGTCETLEQAAGRSLGIAYLHDSEQARDFASWPAALIEELQADCEPAAAVLLPP
jgi:hypothetical protein